jgi:hypothetical protein
MAYGGPDHEEYCGGDQYLEDCLYEENARFDYVNEAFGNQIDNDYEAECEARYYDELHAADVAAFGPYVAIRAAADGWGDDMPF